MTTSRSGTIPAGQRLDAACLALQINLGTEQKATLLEFVAQLHKWNRTYNLTAIRDVDHALVQHLFDSLSVIAPLQDWCDKNTRAAPKILDVGSGGGLPGVVLAIAMPGAQVHCIDAVDKKITFIRQKAGVLKLPNLAAIHARVETIPPMSCDIVISRAFASLEDFAKWSGQHVSLDGCLVAMKGKTPVEEMTALDQRGEWITQRVQSLNVPELEAQRCLVWMHRKGKT